MYECMYICIHVYTYTRSLILVPRGHLKRALKPEEHILLLCCKNVGYTGGGERLLSSIANLESCALVHRFYFRIFIILSCIFTLSSNDREVFQQKWRNRSFSSATEKLESFSSVIKTIGCHSSLIEKLGHFLSAMEKFGHFLSAMEKLESF